MSAALGEFFRELAESNSHSGEEQRTISIVSDNARIITTIPTPRIARELRRWKSLSSVDPLRQASRWEPAPSNCDFSPMGNGRKSKSRRGSSTATGGDCIHSKPVSPGASSDNDDKRWVEPKSRHEYTPEPLLPKSLRSLPY